MRHAAARHPAASVLLAAAVAAAALASLQPHQAAALRLLRLLRLCCVSPGAARRTSLNLRWCSCCGPGDSRQCLAACRSASAKPSLCTAAASLVRATLGRTARLPGCSVALARQSARARSHLAQPIKALMHERGEWMHQLAVVFCCGSCVAPHTCVGNNVVCSVAWEPALLGLRWKQQVAASGFSLHTRAERKRAQDCAFVFHHFCVTPRWASKRVHRGEASFQLSSIAVGMAKQSQAAQECATQLLHRHETATTETVIQVHQENWCAGTAKRGRQ